jgi:hypothetical protein
VFKIKLVMKDGTTSVLIPPFSHRKANALHWARLLRQSKNVIRVVVFKVPEPAEPDPTPGPAA